MDLPEGILEDLCIVVSEFSSFGQGHAASQKPMLDSRNTVKIFKDSGLLDRKHLTRTDIDITFSKVKQKTQSRIDFNQFIELLQILSIQKEIPLVSLVERIVHSRGPQFNHATLTHYNKFHDDKTLYTGVHSQGGPTTIDNKITLSNLADRSPSDVRGVKLDKSKQSPAKPDDFYHLTTAAKLSEMTLNSPGTVKTTPARTPSPKGNNSLHYPGDLHPDYYQVVNPNATGIRDKYYYVNRRTNIPTWERITVPGPPVAKMAGTPPPPPPPTQR